MKSKFIRLDTNLCKACWRCIENCQKKVIRKVDLFFHKHAMLGKADECTGCLKCVKVCESFAIEPIKA